MSLHLAAKSSLIDAQLDGLRLMLVVTSNAYKDREEEIVSRKALEQYVAESWDEDTKAFIGNNPYLLWHGGEPIGDIIYADMEGPFLIEVARERPNAVVDLAREGEEPLLAEIKTVWDMLEREPNLAASQQFAYITGDREDGVYEYIKKMETSALPRWAAANYFTEAQVIRS
jgi:hypothetical protein